MALIGGEAYCLAHMNFLPSLPSYLFNIQIILMRILVEYMLMKLLSFKMKVHKSPSSRAFLGTTYKTEGRKITKET